MPPATKATASEPVVLDASVVIAWLLEEQSPEVPDLVDRLGEEVPVVPGLWHLEVRNALLIAVRRGRLTFPEVRLRLDELRALRIRTDSTPDVDVALDLAARHGLTYYDAIYLELAKRRSTVLATFDRELALAAISEGVEVLPDPD